MLAQEVKAVTLDPNTNFVVLDFEATCWEENDDHEIIEWPMALLDLKAKKIAREFMTFVRPKNAELSDFCKNLTGITQEQVDQGMTFPDALEAATKWLANLPEKDRPVVFLTCGNWDLEKMLPSDLRLHQIPEKQAKVFSNWINIKDLFRQKFPDMKKPSMPDMLKKLNLPLVGRHHRGIDDTRNLAAIVLALLD